MSDIIGHDRSVSLSNWMKEREREGWAHRERGRGSKGGREGEGWKEGEREREGEIKRKSVRDRELI